MFMTLVAAPAAYWSFVCSPASKPDSADRMFIELAWSDDTTISDVTIIGLSGERSSEDWKTEVGDDRSTITLTHEEEGRKLRYTLYREDDQKALVHFNYRYTTPGGNEAFPVNAYFNCTWKPARQ